MSRVLDSKLANAVAAGAAFSVTDNFIYQSYFDSTLLQQAIVPNNAYGNGIASSTLRDRPIAGVGIALLPMSQAPVAVLPTSANGDAATQGAVVLKPGEVYYPGTAFRALKYGLPYGWLGGGTVYMVILRDNIGDVAASGSPEMIVHRQRMLVQATTGNPGSLSPNWPARLPWISAYNNLAQVQPGAPFLGPIFTRATFRLRQASLAAVGTARFLISGTEDFDEQNVAQDATSVYDAASVSGSFIELNFPIFAASGFRVNNVVPAEFPVISVDSASLRLGGDSAIATLIDLGGGNIAGSYVDVVRYGTLG